MAFSVPTISNRKGHRRGGDGALCNGLCRAIKALTDGWSIMLAIRRGWGSVVMWNTGEREANHVNDIQGNGYHAMWEVMRNGSRHWGQESGHGDTKRYLLLVAKLWDEMVGDSMEEISYWDQCGVPRCWLPVIEGSSINDQNKVLPGGCAIWSKLLF